MSIESGVAALNMRFSERVARTEYIADRHPQLIEAVTGIDTSIEENIPIAGRAFIKEWDYAFMWAVTGGYTITKKTNMGHASFTHDGRDFNNDTNCPFKTIDDVLNFDPNAEFPDVPLNDIVDICNGYYKQQTELWPDCVPTVGIYHTLFSGLIDMFGWEMFLIAAGSDEEKFSKVIDSYFTWISRYFEAYAKSDAPFFISHDDLCWTSGPVFAPQWYRKYIFPKYKKLWKPILEAGKRLIYTCDGTYDMFFDDIVDCGAHTLLMEPSNNMGYFADKYGSSHGFVGNADTRILLFGNKEDIYKEVGRCMDIGKKCPGYILAVGNLIPPNTPVDSALYYNDAYMQLSIR